MRAFASVHPWPTLEACSSTLEHVTAAFAGRAKLQSNIRTIIRRWYPRHQACSLGCAPTSCGSGSRQSHSWRRLLSATRGISIDSAETPSSRRFTRLSLARRNAAQERNPPGRARRATFYTGRGFQPKTSHIPRPSAQAGPQSRPAVRLVFAQPRSVTFCSNARFLARA